MPQAQVRAPRTASAFRSGSRRHLQACGTTCFYAANLSRTRGVRDFGCRHQSASRHSSTLDAHQNGFLGIDEAGCSRRSRTSSPRMERYFTGKPRCKQPGLSAVRRSGSIFGLIASLTAMHDYQQHLQAAHNRCSCFGKNLLCSRWATGHSWSSARGFSALEQHELQSRSCIAPPTRHHCRSVRGKRRHTFANLRLRVKITTKWCHYHLSV